MPISKVITLSALLACVSMEVQYMEVQYVVMALYQAPDSKF